MAKIRGMLLTSKKKYKASEDSRMFSKESPQIFSLSDNNNNPRSSLAPLSQGCKSPANFIIRQEFLAKRRPNKEKQFTRFLAVEMKIPQQIQETTREKDCPKVWRQLENERNNLTRNRLFL
ncbi:hypothetical protein AVEN_207673-1 [Araneus ventricosus]|uniref:Uncharacterized protein n=1 Tax=Araneus ventricosus TaxID=182803 RepID=A0A4Y2LPL9_ARAVE|nr:hypothetical protein AVEN_207673-1 [Araneus ventricosus]